MITDRFQENGRGISITVPLNTEIGSERLLILKEFTILSDFLNR